MAPSLHETGRKQEFLSVANQREPALALLVHGPGGQLPLQPPCLGGHRFVPLEPQERRGIGPGGRDDLEAAGMGTLPCRAATKHKDGTPMATPPRPAPRRIFSRHSKREPVCSIWPRMAFAATSISASVTGRDAEGAVAGFAVTAAAFRMGIGTVEAGASLYPNPLG